jgi:flagellar FliJ protein
MQEEQAQIKHAEAVNRLQMQQEILSSFQSQLASNLNLLGKAQSGSPTIETLKTFSNYIDKIKREIIDQQEQVTKAAAYHQECLAELEDAIKQRKLVDNLREKRLEQYQNEILQEEQKLLDELGTQAFVRDRRVN